MKSVYDMRISHGLLPPTRPLTGHPTNQTTMQKRQQLKSAMVRTEREPGFNL